MRSDLHQLFVKSAGLWSSRTLLRERLRFPSTQLNGMIFIYYSFVGISPRRTLCPPGSPLSCLYRWRSRRRSTIYSRDRLDSPHRWRSRPRCARSICVGPLMVGVGGELARVLACGDVARSSFSRRKERVTSFDRWALTHAMRGYAAWTALSRYSHAKKKPGQMDS